MSGGKIIDPRVKNRAVTEFVDTWQDYRSVTVACGEIAASHGMSRATLFAELRERGQWPAARVGDLALENKRLRKQVQMLETQLAEGQK
ncbi:hypothetical protein M0E87_00115 [Corynebacterium sp. CCM 9185]|uniref:Transposase n=1 Tax=Corynebacterium marambiense TaxID=2765364 RepID=A0ABS0W162_9CORY|nr:hypothetical protein [Corynebacterium marambiense]MBI9001610.1 hypothetical protein [Corynebacterium marambiense]MCK7662074.1 hypothetical protein [Corynebacterium marambiense]